MAEWLDELPDLPSIDTTTAALEWLSTDRMAHEMHSPPTAALRAHFTGALQDAHDLAVRTTTRILGELQDALSEIGASLEGQTPLRGPLPGDIVRSTDLNFSPMVRPGSVIFTLRPREASELWERDEPTLLERSLVALFGVFDRIERPRSTGSFDADVSDTLRDFGPRTARHLFGFAEALSSDGLNVDFGWSRSNGSDQGSAISVRGAAFLSSLAKKATTKTDPVTLRGTVYRLGDDNKHRFNDQTRGLVTIESSSEVTDALALAFRRHLAEVDVTATESVSTASGKVKWHFAATGARVLDEPAE
jgi:hypothetical protein